MIQATDPTWIGVSFDFGRWNDPETLRSAIGKLGPHVFHTHVSCTDFDGFGNESAIDYAYAFPAIAQRGFGGALSIAYQGKRELPDEGVARMRDLLVKLWIGKRMAPVVPPAVGANISSSKN
jgi:sugar phosphate isomerase/epimerase